MGIPGYYGKFLTRRVKHAIIQGLSPIVSSLSFDLNGVFHAAKNKVFGEVTSSTDPRLLLAITRVDPARIQSDIENQIEIILLGMIRATKPRDCLILAVDGPAPAAKLAQQKGRREKAAKERSSIDMFDSNAITPGTDFMIQLDIFMLNLIRKYRDELPPKVIYSSHLEPGEGEHKIMQYYRNGDVDNGSGAHVLYGLDADLIMLSLLSPVAKIFLSRETQEESVDIDTFRDYINQTLGGQDLVHDFVVMMFLLGNDFLPHQPSLEQTEEAVVDLIEIYIKANVRLTIEGENSRTIDWDGMKQFFSLVHDYEKDIALPSRASKRYDYPSKMLQEATREGMFYYSTYREAWYRNALGYKGQRDYVSSLLRIASTYQSTTEDYFVNSRLSQQTIGSLTDNLLSQRGNMIESYCRTMEWNYLYYREGTYAVNHDWYYPYYHAPLFGDLKDISFQNIFGYAAYPGMVIFNVLQQLVAVIPIKSVDILPPELRPLFSYDSPIRDLYPSNFIVEIDGRNKYKNAQGKIIEPHSVPFVPFVDKRRVIEAVQQIEFSFTRILDYVPVIHTPFIRERHTQERLDAQRYDQQLIQEFQQRQQEYIRRREQKQERKEGKEIPISSNMQQTRGRGDRGRGRGDRGRGRGRGDKPTTTFQRPFQTNNSSYRGRGVDIYQTQRPMQALTPLSSQPTEVIMFGTPVNIQPTDIPILSTVPIGVDFNVSVGKIEPNVNKGEIVKPIDISRLQNKLSGVSETTQLQQSQLQRSQQPQRSPPNQSSNKYRPKVPAQSTVLPKQNKYRPLQYREKSSSNIVQPTIEIIPQIAPSYPTDLSDIPQPILNPDQPDTEKQLESNKILGSTWNTEDPLM